MQPAGTYPAPVNDDQRVIIMGFLRRLVGSLRGNAKRAAKKPGRKGRRVKTAARRRV